MQALQPRCLSQLIGSPPRDGCGEPDAMEQCLLPVSNIAAVMNQHKIVHLTSVHNLHDNRVFEKECVSLAQAGFDVALVVPDDGPDRQLQGVRILTVPKPKSRLKRMTVTTRQVVARALAEKADLYQFHDPELIPFALALRATGKPVIFDVHEDYVTSIRKGHWLPKPVATAVAFGYDYFERVAKLPYRTVIAERYYSARFPDAVPVLNYPRLDRFAAIMEQPIRQPPTKPRLLYTGTLVVDRGGLIYADLARDLPDAEIHLIGWAEPATVTAMQQRGGTAAGRMTFEGVNERLPFSRIVQAYAEAWTCGLAIMPETEHYREKELTKFFEYMAAGLPIVASNFPVWKALIEGQGVGICVDPAKPSAIRDAVQWLVAHPDEARAMGERGRAAVRSTYNWDREAQRLVSMIRQLIGDST